MVTIGTKRFQKGIEKHSSLAIHSDTVASSSQEELEEQLENGNAQGKPVFLTKAQRQELALKKKHKEADARRKKLEEERKARISWEKERREREQRESYPRGRRRDRRERDRDHRESREGSKYDDKVDPSLQPDREKVLEVIKRQYLGAPKEKRIVVRSHDRAKKYVFAWDASEDTSRDIDPLAEKSSEVSMLFGRGMRAGIDRREQMKASQHYEDIIRTKNQEIVTHTGSGKDAVAKTKHRSDAMDSRDVHWTDKPLEMMKERDWRIFREDFNITHRGGKVPLPIRYWHEANLPDIILNTLKDLKFKDPTPIQRQCIPIGVQNRDLIGVAETGSGKTLAFVIPMLLYVARLPKMTPTSAQAGPYAIVLAPTRELAQQIHEETEKLAQPLGFTSYPLVGGVPIEEQTYGLKDGAEIIIATPGRLNDFLESRLMVLSQCCYSVLDEADRMVDMGFLEQVEAILDAMPVSNRKPASQPEEDIFSTDTVKVRQRKNPFAAFNKEDKDTEMNMYSVAKADTVSDIIYRETIMFSATMPTAVERIARKYLSNPALVIVGNAGQASTDVDQQVEMMKESAKMPRLQQVLRNQKPPILVFVNTKKTADVVCKKLETARFRATALHGGKNQELREASLEAFKDGRYEVLVATDVMQRGIDVQGVSMVINFEMPKKIEDYTHRIGRTGRAGAKGIALSFLTNDDEEIMYDLKQMLESNKMPVPPQLANHEAAKIKPGAIDQQRKRPTIIYSKK